MKRKQHLASRFLAAFGLIIGLAACITSSATAALAGSTPWAVIKCKFSDQPQEPAFHPAFITGADGLAGYWRDMSYGQISLDGSLIYGWFTLPFTLAESVSKSRAELIDACKAATTGVDFSQFYSVIAIMNARRDSGSQGGRVLLDPDAWVVSFGAHELGHGYNLPHSWSANPDSEYGNPWDIMSAMGVHYFQGSFGRSDGPLKYAAGPGLNAPNLNRLGWLPADRVVSWDGNAQTVTIAALNHPEANGYLMAKVPFDAADPDHYYAIEFRRKTGWDQGIPQDTVLINEVRANGLAYLIGSDGGPQRLTNMTFRDADNNLVISVLNLNLNTSTAVVNMGKSEEWADFNYQGATERGTFDQPHNTLAEGLNTVGHGGTLKIKAGARSETALISKKFVIEAYSGPVTIGN